MSKHNSLVFNFEKSLKEYKRKKEENSKSDTQIIGKLQRSFRKRKDPLYFIPSTHNLFSEDSLSRHLSFTTVIDVNTLNQVKQNDGTMLLYRPSKSFLNASSCDNVNYDILMGVAKDIIRDVVDIMKKLQFDMFMSFVRLHMEVGKSFAKLEQEQEKYWDIFFINLYYSIYNADKGSERKSEKSSAGDLSAKRIKTIADIKSIVQTPSNLPKE